MMTEAARKRLTLLMKAAVTLALLAVALHWVRLDVLAASLRRAQPGPLLAAALLLVLGGFAGAASWFCILRARLPAMRFRDAAACHWCGMFFNSFLPSNVGGDVVKGYIVVREQGQTGFVVTSLLLDRVANLGMLLCIGVFTFLLQLGYSLWAVGFLLLLAVSLLGVLASAVRLRDKVRGVPRRGLAGKVE